MIGLKRARRILLRGFMLKCPACGKESLYKLFKMKPSCGSCGLVFEREQGYFVGAIYINVIVTEGLLGSIYLLSILTGFLADKLTDTALFALAILLPLLFFRHARSLWLSIDYAIDPPASHKRV
jgi:uncharacterized protein (DUF983 family)